MITEVTHTTPYAIRIQEINNTCNWYHPQSGYCLDNGKTCPHVNQQGRQLPDCGLRKKLDAEGKK